MNLSELSKTIHAANKKWWEDINTGEPIERNKGELLCLIHSEVSEAMEGERKNLMDTHLPHYPMPVVEIADTVIRCLDYVAGFWPDVDFQEVFDAKMEYNRKRADHSHESRKGVNGKRF